MTSAGGPLAPLAPPAPLEPAPTAAPTYVNGSFVSAARGGIDTNWAIARPPGQTGTLRPVIALHGKGADAAQVMAGGVEQGLAQAVAAGLPPFAVVAVDGGGGYWHKRASGEDSGAMVLDELIPMLGSQGLDTSRVAFLGWSMGGYGALLLGARLGAARTAAICAVSPALWTSSGAAAPGAFDGADDYAANTVWGLPGLGVDTDPDRLRQQRSLLLGHPAVHRATAQPTLRRLLARRARRRILEFTIACRTGVDGAVADGLDLDLAFSGGQPDIGAKVAARQPDRFHPPVRILTRGSQVGPGADHRKHPPSG